MQRRRRFFFLLLVAAGLSYRQPASAQQGSVAFDSLENAIRADMSAAGVPGAAVAVVSGDRVLFAKAFGVSSVESGAPVTTDMLFRIGPLTRVFTSTALLVLEEQNRIAVNAPIRECIASLPARIAQITPHQLLSETAGFRASEFAMGALDETAIGRRLHMISERDLFTTPGHVYSQSAIGYTIAAALIEVAAAEPFADVVHMRVFQPLGMKASTFRTGVAVTHPFALGHTGDDARAVVLRPVPENTLFAPAELMYSSIDDLVRFVTAFMSGGQIDGRNALSQGLIAKLTGRYAPVPSDGAGATGGYGLVSKTHRGVRVLEQDGSTPGFSAALRIAPDHQFAVIVLANRDGARFDRTTETAMELLVPLSAPALSKAAPQRWTAADRTQLPGHYQNGHTILQITADARGLTFVQSGEKRTVEKIADTRFYAAATQTTPAIEFTAIRGANGQVAYLHAGSRAFARLR